MPSVSSATGFAVNVPSPVQVEEAMNSPVPEEILDSWRWINQGREEGLFDPYAGKHIAVFDRKLHFP
jgi:hypothetical protein